MLSKTLQLLVLRGNECDASWCVYILLLVHVNLLDQLFMIQLGYICQNYSISYLTDFTRRLHAFIAFSIS